MSIITFLKTMSCLFNTTLRSYKQASETKLNSYEKKDYEYFDKI